MAPGATRSPDRPNLLSCPQSPNLPLPRDAFLSTATVHVALRERSYEIEIGKGLLSHLPGQIGHLDRVTHIVVITDNFVAPIYGERVVETLQRPGSPWRVQSLIVEAGESSKSVSQANQLWEMLIEAGADRQTLILALGGGVIGDLAGFVAATFARGLRLVQIPTTLLAQVDSSVGGKVGVNLSRAKNMVGAFWQPARVVVDTETLDTLPDRQYRAGLAEVVKYGVILDADFFQFLESRVAEIQQRDPESLKMVIQRCCRLKADVVEQDERELTGIRAMLNYGHTFGHALETLTGYGQWLHGEAVAMGMMCAARLAESMGRVTAELTERQEALLGALGLPTADIEIDAGRMLEAMQRDKKTAHGRLRFVLPTRLGHVELVEDVDPQLARAALRGSP
jgi:3-dehydroquinate synthase